MPIPTHTSSCITKTIITNCQYCKEEVYYFSCNCGSKVFFDYLGYPWPIHNCEERFLYDYLNFLSRVKLLTDQEIREQIEKDFKQRNKPLTDQFQQIIDNELGLRKYPFSVNTMDANKDIDILSGTIISFDKKINFEKKYKVHESPITMAGLLKELGKETYGVIKLRERPNKKNISNEYVIYVSESYYQRNKLSLNDNILCNVKFSNNYWENFLILDTHSKIEKLKPKNFN